MFIICFVSCLKFLEPRNKRGHTKRILLNNVFIPELLNKPLASCCFANFDILLSHAAHFDKSIIIPCFVLATFRFLLSLFFLHFKQYDNIV